MKRKALKAVAISYALKTLLVGIAWLFVPDLPERALSTAKRTWSLMNPARASLRAD